MRFQPHQPQTNPCPLPQVLAVGSQGDMLAHQAAARGLALPTHTYATLSKEQGRGPRSVMAIGPAPGEQLDRVSRRAGRGPVGA